MMMAMLAAGGVPVLEDGHRPADAHNPSGYFEHTGSKHLSRNPALLEQAKGMAVKVISLHLFDLPPQHHYDIIFMERPLAEILLSQQVMLADNQENRGVFTADLPRLLGNHLEHVNTWMRTQSNFRTLAMQHSEVITNPLLAADTINQFLGGHLSPQAMADAVRPELYRSK